MKNVQLEGCTSKVNITADLLQQKEKKNYQGKNRTWSNEL
jgi:hypothetical protein